MVAVDLSSDLLAIGRERLSGTGAARVACGDAEALPFPDGSFDLVVGHAFLHHLPEPAAALREAHRVLVPGGAVLFAGEPTRIGDRVATATGSPVER